MPRQAKRVGVASQSGAEDSRARPGQLFDERLAELELLYRTAPVGLCLVDGALRFIRINDELAAINGRPAGEHIGRTLGEVLPELAATLEPIYRRVLETGEPALNFEVHGVTPADPQTEKDWLVNYYPFKDSSDRILGVSTVVQDITQRKRVERALQQARDELEARVLERTAELLRTNEDLRVRNEALGRAEEGLRHSEGRHRHLLEDIDEVSFTLDATGLITYMSPAIERLSGYRPDEIVGHVLTKFVHPGDLAAVIGSFERTVGGNPEPFEYRVVGKTGGTIWLRSRSQPIREGDRIVGLWGVLTDITDRHRAEEQTRHEQMKLERTQRLTSVGATTAQIAHEINQPLGAIANFANGLTARLRVGSVERSDILLISAQIAAEAERAGEVIRRLRRLVRRRETKPEPCDLNAVVTHLHGLTRKELLDNGIETRFDLDPALPLLDLDRVQVEQVILNLLRNALEAMTQERTGPRHLSVETHCGDDEIQVTVRDSGVGLPFGPDDQIFEPFFTTKADGLGLGLAVSRSIIEATSGHLWVARNADRGTTVGFTLPRTLHG